MAFKFNPFTGNLDLVSEEVPGGSSTQVQFNDAGVFAGNSGFTFDKTSGRLTTQGYGIGSSAIITVAGTSRTLSAADNGKVLYCTSSSAVTIQTASGLGAGFSCVIIQGGTGQVTVQQGSGTTLVSYGASYRAAGQYAAVTAISPVADTFVLMGQTA